MLQRLKKHRSWLAIATLSALAVGMGGGVLHTLGRNPEAPVSVDAPTPDSPGDAMASDTILQLARLAPEQRQPALERLAEGKVSQNRNRARYLLAQDLVDQGRGGQAIPLLTDLHQDYPEMAVYSLLLLAQAQQASGQAEAAAATRQQALADYGDDPAVAPLLYEAGKADPSQWNVLLERFPAHPRSVDIAVDRLQTDPNRRDALPLLLLVARYGLHHPSASATLDRLSQEFSSQLTPEHWQTIGYGYWKLDIYGKSGKAYAKAPPSPLTLYRAARGQQVTGNSQAAIRYYTLLDQQFPDAPETAQGLLRLTESLPSEKALGVLDQVMARFPDRAAEALQKRAEELEALNSAESAQAARQSILTQYSGSTVAADIRLKQAFTAAEASDLETALNWALEVVKHGPETDAAAEAGFWAGKWARQLGKADVAQTSFEKVIAFHPESYYAWRAAVALGWNVGDFKTVRAVNPQVELPRQRSPLPAGSDTLEELYRLGQDQTAWERWQTEFTNRESWTVAEQYTDGLMRLGVGDNLDGIYTVSSLSLRDHPDDQAEYHSLKQKPDYWMAVYPFPFVDLIEQWSQERQLNPLLVTALIRQESRFEPKIRSAVGAAGLMQVMPATAEWIQLQTGIPTYNLDNPNDNINLGTWYLKYTHQEYDNHSLFAVASYNAGPGNVAKWISRGGYVDADDFVERIPFPETKGYVESVFGGYWNYLRLYNPAIAEQVAEYQSRYALLPPVSP